MSLLKILGYNVKLDKVVEPSPGLNLVTGIPRTKNIAHDVTQWPPNTNLVRTDPNVQVQDSYFSTDTEYNTSSNLFVNFLV